MSGKELAQAAKAKGNAALSAKDFDGAIKHYTEAITHDPSDHVFFSNRSAAYLSKGDAMHALDDAEECVKLAPSWGKGYSRLGAAHFALRAYDDAIRVYEDGLKLEPTNEAMREGLEDAKTEKQRAQARASSGSGRPGGFGGMVDPFGPGMFERIAANPKFAPYLADPDFTAKLRRITDGKDTKARSDALMEALSGSLGMAGMPGAAGAGAGGPSDPRLMEVVMFLLGGAQGMGAGMGGMDVDGEEDDGEDGAAEGDDEEAARAAFMRGAAQGRAGSGPGSSSSSYQPPRRDPAAEAAAAAERKKREEEAAAKRAEEEEAALSEEERAKRVAKRQAVARKEEGNKAYKARDFDAALRLYQEAYELDSEDITYLLNAAAVHFERAQWEEAIATCRKALERGSEVFAPYALKAKAWARIGNAEAKRGNLQAAVEAYESSLLESHTDEVYEKAKKAKAELKARAEAAYRDPAKGAEAKERGNDLFKAGKFKEAIAEYSDAIRRDPECAAYYSNRAAALTKVMDVSGAMADCDKCLKLDPKFTRGYVRKGNLHLLTKELHKALEQYQAALALDPECEEAREGMRRTVGKINEQSSSGQADPERAARAMDDPEIRRIMRDPMVNAALEDMERDPTAMRRVMADPAMGAKIQKLIAAGIVGVR